VNHEFSAQWFLLSAFQFSNEMASGIAVDPQNARYRVPAHSICNSAVWLKALTERLIYQSQ